MNAALCEIQKAMENVRTLWAVYDRKLCGRQISETNTAYNRGAEAATREIFEQLLDAKIRLQNELDADLNAMQEAD